MRIFRIERAKKLYIRAKRALPQNRYGNGLPASIIRHIARYATGMERELGHIDGHMLPRVDPSLMQLVGVCQQWRAALKHLFYQCAVLDTLEGRGGKATYRDGLPDITLAMATGQQSLVSTARVYFTPDLILTRRTETLLSEPPFHGSAVFDSVKNLLLVCKYNECASSLLDANNTASESAMLIKRFGDIVLKMFPNATERAFCTFPTKKHDKHDKRWIQQLLMQMSTDVAGLQYDIHGYEIELEGFVPYSGLARIRIQMDSLKAAHLELVRRNADTLESIHIGTIDAVMAGFLVRKHGGSLVTYPQLKCLLISARRNRHVDGGNSPRGMPFPNLRYLICREHYPFDNGILFRGNSGTLEKLVIGVDESALANWTFSNLLISGTHKKLNTVTVFTYRKGKQMLLPKKRVPELLQVTFRLPPTVQQLKLYTKCTLGGYAALTGIRATEKPYGLRVLDMYHTHFTLKQAAELVRAMPLLEKLTIVLVRDEGKAAISKGDIEQLHSQYYPISKRLRILEHGDFDSDAARGYSLGMLAFASLAPSLCLIRAHEKPKPRFLCDLKEAAQDPLLAPFTKHLSALRFTMLPGYPGVPPDYTQVANFT